MKNPPTNPEAPAKITPCFENGKCALASGLRNGAGCGTTELHVLRAMGKLDANFLFFLSISDTYRKLGEAEMYGAGGQKRVPPEFNKDFRTPLPPISEQRAIAAFLDRETARLDTLIAKNRTLIERLKEKRTALISHAVTRGLNPAAKLKPSGIEWLGDIPISWNLERLRRTCTRITDGAHISPDLSSPDYPFVSTVDVNDGQIDLVGCIRCAGECYEYLVHTGCRPRKGDVLFSKDGTVGRTAVVRGEEDFVVASSLVIVSPKSAKLESRFLDYWLNNNLFQQYTLLQISGAALPRISVEKVARLPIVLPTTSEQHAIADFLDCETAKIDRLSAKVEDAITRLHEYRLALITAAVTGKIDISINGV